MDDVLAGIENGRITDVMMLGRLFADLHSNYYNYEWKWACYMIQEYYGLSLESVTVEKLSELIIRWRSSVIALDNLIYEDARKEFTLAGLSGFDDDPFVKSVREHIANKTALADKALKKIVVPLD